MDPQTETTSGQIPPPPEAIHQKRTKKKNKAKRKGEADLADGAVGLEELYELTRSLSQSALNPETPASLQRKCFQYEMDYWYLLLDRGVEATKVEDPRSALSYVHLGAVVNSDADFYRVALEFMEPSKLRRLLHYIEPTLSALLLTNPDPYYRAITSDILWFLSTRMMSSSGREIKVAQICNLCDAMLNTINFVPSYHRQQFTAALWTLVRKEFVPVAAKVRLKEALCSLFPPLAPNVPLSVSQACKAYPRKPLLKIVVGNALLKLANSLKIEDSRARLLAAVYAKINKLTMTYIGSRSIIFGSAAGGFAIQSSDLDVTVPLDNGKVQRILAHARAIAAAGHASVNPFPAPVVNRRTVRQRTKKGRGTSQPMWTAERTEDLTDGEKSDEEEINHPNNVEGRRRSVGTDGDEHREQTVDSEDSSDSSEQPSCDEFTNGERASGWDWMDGEDRRRAAAIWAGRWLGDQLRKIGWQVELIERANVPVVRVKACVDEDGCIRSLPVRKWTVARDNTQRNMKHWSKWVDADGVLHPLPTLTEEEAPPPIDDAGNRKKVLVVCIDISFMREVVVHNTRLMRSYARFDPRTKHLALIIKHWAKTRDICSSYRGTLSGYQWLLMAIHYMQHCCECTPHQRIPIPLLPNLQRPPPFIRRFLADRIPSENVVRDKRGRHLAACGKRARCPQPPPDYSADADDRKVSADANLTMMGTHCDSEIVDWYGENSSEIDDMSSLSISSASEASEVRVEAASEKELKHRREQIMRDKIASVHRSIHLTPASRNKMAKKFSVAKKLRLWEDDKTCDVFFFDPQYGNNRPLNHTNIPLENIGIESWLWQGTNNNRTNAASPTVRTATAMPGSAPFPWLPWEEEKDQSGFDYAMELLTLNSKTADGKNSGNSKIDFFGNQCSLDDIKLSMRTYSRPGHFMEKEVGLLADPETLAGISSAIYSLPLMHDRLEGKRLLPSGVVSLEMIEGFFRYCSLNFSSHSHVFAINRTPCFPQRKVRFFSPACRGVPSSLVTKKSGDGRSTGQVRNLHSWKNRRAICISDPFERGRSIGPSCSEGQAQISNEFVRAVRIFQKMRVKLGGLQLSDVSDQSVSRVSELFEATLSELLEPDQKEAFVCPRERRRWENTMMEKEHVRFLKDRVFRKSRTYACICGAAAIDKPFVNGKHRTQADHREVPCSAGCVETKIENYRNFEDVAFQLSKSLLDQVVQEAAERPSENPSASRRDWGPVRRTQIERSKSEAFPPLQQLAAERGHRGGPISDAQRSARGGRGYRGMR